VSSAANPKALEERGIFECFAEAAGLVVSPESITQPDPPDICCEIEGLGPVAFELVKLDTAAEMQRMGYLDRSREFWSDAAKALKPEELQRHRGARITVVFDPKADQAMRRNAMRFIAGVLRDSPEGAKGPIANPPDGLESAVLSFYPENGGVSVFEVSGCAVQADPVQIAPSGIHLDRIDKKIAKYATGWGVRAELLAYARYGMPFSDQVHEVPKYLAERFPGGIFQRGWIYEVTSHLVVACAP
jgi:hypothetical protein